MRGKQQFSKSSWEHGEARHWAIPTYRQALQVRLAQLPSALWAFHSYPYPLLAIPHL